MNSEWIQIDEKQTAQHNEESFSWGSNINVLSPFRIDTYFIEASQVG